MASRGRGGERPGAQDRLTGSAQIMGVVRHIHDTEGPGETDGVGWAAGAGVTVSLPVGGLGFSTQMGYARRRARLYHDGPRWHRRFQWPVG